MAGRDGKRFHLFDGMVLIAALAIGLVSARTYLGITNNLPRGSLGSWINALHTAGVPFGLVWSVALVLIRVQAPRRERRRLCGQPGFTAALAVVACAAVVVLDHVARNVLLWAKSGTWAPFDTVKQARGLYQTLMLAAPSAVAATWTVLALSGRWRPERSCLDRLGLLLGVYWITWPEIAWLVALGV